MRSLSLLSLLGISAVSSSLAGLALAQAQAQNATANDTCNTGIHMIASRGSLEPAGAGLIGLVANNVSDKISGSVVVPLEYPATISNYSTSEAAGVEALTDLLTSYIALCPSAKIALLGYSQGAQVTADTLCGTDDGKNFKLTPDLSSSYEDNIIAVVLFGDPSHVVGAAWNEGTSTRNGIFPRQNNSACDPYSSKMRSWCDTGDIYCDSGNNTKTHGTYFANYTMDAVNFIIEKFNETLTGSESGSGSGSGSGSNGTDGGGSSGGGSNSTGSGDSKAPSVSVPALPVLLAILVSIVGPGAFMS